ncbi:MAG: hypothetical protein B5M46_02445 [Epsilonproteobacteria bacterium 4484_20]|nr:MAG: hypothetical protein B5M46_02445 [Epsilonproteobacteria bacterium 4484_20]
MNEKNVPDKEKLLDEIETLIAYGKEEPTINPSLLAYLSLDDLISIKTKLLGRAGTSGRTSSRIFSSR